MLVFKKARGRGLFKYKNMKSFLDYLAGVRAELTHIKWPTTAQAMGYTVLVIVVSLVVAALLGVFDFAFTLGIEEIIKNF